MKQWLVCYALVLCTFVSLGQAPIVGWQRALGGTSYDGASSIIQCSDSCFVVTGTIQSSNGDVLSNHGLYDCWVVKLSRTGSIMWQRSLGGTSSDNPTCIRQTADGGFILAANTNSSDGDVSTNHGMIDAWIVKLDDTGAIVWERSLGGSGADEALSITQAADGGYIMAGWSNSTDGDLTENNGDEDIWVVKLTATGSISWQKSMGGSDEDHATAVAQTADGGYIVSGFVSSVDSDVVGNHGLADYWLLKFSATGTPLWQQCLGGSNEDLNGDHAYGGTISQTTDGGYIASGWSRSNDGDVTGNHGDYDCWIVKLTSTGSITWQRSLGGTLDDEANAVYQTTDGGYIVAGTSNSADGDVSGVHGLWDFWLVKLSPTGAIEWQAPYGGLGKEVAFGMQQTLEGNYIVAGYTNNSSGDVSGVHGSNFDFWVAHLVPLASLGVPGLACTAQVYPNPAADELNIIGAAGAQLWLHDAVGRQVLQQQLLSGHSIINIAHLPAGTYIAHWQYADGTRQVARVVKLAQ